MTITQEAVTAEINYRLERAQAAALVTEARQARKARHQRPSRLRRWLTRASRPPVRHTTPALR